MSTPPDDEPQAPEAESDDPPEQQTQAEGAVAAVVAEQPVSTRPPDPVLAPPAPAVERTPPAPAQAASRSSTASPAVSGTTTAPGDRYDYGEVSDVGWFSRFLWFCAGGDAQLLVRCPNSDRVKFQGLGGVVFTVGILAFFSGSYAFYAVFSPKDATVLAGTGPHYPSVALSAFFGLVWALIIFNIDRFIVSSTGKGDGTEKITFNEFTNALPRLAMALIIGLCLSKPLEIKILESEIEAHLEKEQKAYLGELNGVAEELVSKERKRLREKIDGFQERIDDNDSTLEKRRLEINAQRKQLELEAEGKTGSGHAGRGPAWRDKRDNLDQLQAELERDRAAIEKKNATKGDELAEAKAELSELDGKLAEQKKSNEAIARHLDGLMKRIQISHDIGGWIPFAIMLLLLCIEAGPIFFKLMIIKGAYDYIEENQKRLARARAGIEPDARMVTDGKGKHVLLDIHHVVNSILEEEKRRLDTERLLATEVHEAYRLKLSEEIKKDPTAFLQQD
jgi:hypothetical protein